MAYRNNKDFLKSSSVKAVVRIQNSLVEMITEWPGTKIAKTNLIPQKTWAPGAWPVSLMYLSHVSDNKQLLTNEALDMMWYRPDNTNIGRGEAEVNIGILWSISHHIQCLISQ